MVASFPGAFQATPTEGLADPSVVTTVARFPDALHETTTFTKLEPPVSTINERRRVTEKLEKKSAEVGNLSPLQNPHVPIPGGVAVCGVAVGVSDEASVRGGGGVPDGAPFQGGVGDVGVTDGGFTDGAAASGGVRITDRK